MAKKRIRSAVSSDDAEHRVTLVVKKRLLLAGLFEVLFLVPAPVLYFSESAGQAMSFSALVLGTIVLRAGLFKRGTPMAYAMSLAIAASVLVFACCGAAAATVSKCNLNTTNVTVIHYRDDVGVELHTNKTKMSCFLFVSSFRVNILRPFLGQFGVEDGPHGMSFPTIYEIPCQAGMLYMMHKLFMDSHILPFVNNRLPNAAVLFLDLADTVQMLMAFFQHDAYLLFESETWTTLPVMDQVPFKWGLLSLTLIFWIATVLQASIEFYMSVQGNYIKGSVDHLERPVNTFNQIRSLLLNMSFLMARMILRFQAGYFSPLFQLKNMFFTVIGIYFPCCASRSSTADSLNRFVLEFLPGGSQVKKEQFTDLLKEFIEMKAEIEDQVETFESRVKSKLPNEVVDKHTSYMKEKAQWLGDTQFKFDPDKLQEKAMAEIGVRLHIT